MRAPLRLLLVADTHLGFDDPLRARVDRRRRGPDFFSAFERALLPALRGEVDAVVHGGDLLYRSQVEASLVARALQPLLRVAEAGVPVYLVPGNHERSRIPFPILAAHRNLFLFDRPRTFHHTLAGLRVALAGFPYAPQVRGRFPGLLAETRWGAAEAEVRLLCLHQAVEGARVGTPEFTFTDGDDVVRGRDVPGGFAAVLSGHIHRGQRLTRGLDGRPLAAPWFYPGAVERTSFAEREETKGYLVLRMAAEGAPGGRVEGFDWCPLETRPMVREVVEAEGLEGAALEGVVRRRLAALPRDAVVRLELRGAEELPAWRLRALAPPEMNVELAGARRGRPLMLGGQRG